MYMKSCLYVYIYHMHAVLTETQRGYQVPLELELQMITHCRMGAGV